MSNYNERLRISSPTCVVVSSIMNHDVLSSYLNSSNYDVVEPCAGTAVGSMVTGVNGHF